MFSPEERAANPVKAPKLHQTHQGSSSIIITSRVWMASWEIRASVLGPVRGSCVVTAWMQTISNLMLVLGQPLQIKS